MRYGGERLLKILKVHFQQLFYHVRSNVQETVNGMVLITY